MVDNNATARPGIRPAMPSSELSPIQRRRREDSTIAHPRPHLRPFAARIQFAWLVFAAAGWTLALAALPVDPDYTSGELLDHLSSWRAGAPLYPALEEGPPFRVLNYPPLAFLVSRALAGGLGLSDLLAGRLGNALAFLGLLAAAGAWARARGCRGDALLGTVGLLGASFPVLYAAGQFHIELWAVAFTVAGFALLDRGSRPRDAVLAGLALALACWSKQTQVVPVGVALAWVWSQRRTLAAPATAAFACAGAIGAAGLTLAWGLEPWRHMLPYTVGTFSLANLAAQALSHAGPWVVLLAFVARTARREGRNALGDPLLWFWGGALFWALSAARVGSSYAYFLDLHVATALWAGPRLFAATRPPASRIGSWLLALQVLAADAGAGAALGVNLARLRGLARELPRVCARLPGGAEGAPPAGTHFPILSEDVGVARACGERVAAHPFVMASLARRGFWDPAPLEAAFREGRVSVALLPFDPRETARGAHAERWPPALLGAFAAAPSVERAGTRYWIARW